MSDRNTRQLITEAATSLFNQETVAAVSTNHIAQAAGISPGNLYYHFGNREEIVRAIFEMMVADWEAVWRMPAGRTLESNDVSEMLVQSFRLHWRYRFFQRERLALLARDDELRARYRAVYEQRTHAFSMLADSLVASGVILTSATNLLPLLLEGLWIVSEEWVGHLEITGDPTDETQMRRGVEVILALLRPHLSNEALDGFTQQGEDNEDS